MNKKCYWALMLCATLLVLFPFVAKGEYFSKKKDSEMEVKKFIDEHVAQVKPLYKEALLAYWNASISGKDEDYAKNAELQFRLEKIYSDKALFEKVKAWKESGKVKDKYLKRELELLYLNFLQHQIPEDLLKEIIDKSNKVEQLFNTYRSTVDGKEVTMNKIEEVLRTSVDSNERQKYWEAQKQVGEKVEKELKELVRLRNKSARLLGFSNFYTMSLTFNEQDEKKIIKLFDDLDKLTSKRFAVLKKEIDDTLSKRYGIKPEEMKPWHYNDSFFQEAPQIYNADFDTYLKKFNLLDLTTKYFQGIGLEVNDILKRSDLYEKPGKNPHAFETNIDKEGDIRILANIQNNDYWLDTMLHESGHAVYDKYIDKKLPYVLKEVSHISWTESIAQLFGRFSKNAWWMQQMLSLSEEERKKIEVDAYKVLQSQELVFSRWTQVMLRFERELYRNPDQNLNKLWWDLVKEYQMVTPPEGRDKPDYAAKIHFSSSPVYYHNYQIGELIASQVHATIVKKVLNETDLIAATYIGHKQVGIFMVKEIFSKGSTRRWDELIKDATGEELNPEYFAEQFVK